MYCLESFKSLAYGTGHSITLCDVNPVLKFCHVLGQKFIYCRPQAQCNKQI